MIKMKSILKEGKGFYHVIWEIMGQETSKYMKPRNQMVNMAGPAGSERKSGTLVWGQPGQSTWFAELAPTQLQKDGTAMYGLLTIECKPEMADQLWSKLSSKFLSNMKPGDPTSGYDARTWVVSIDSALRAAGMINYLATTLKESVRLKEGYAWERQEGKALPTLAEVQAAYDKRMREEAKPDYIDIDNDGDETEPMKKAVADKDAKEDDAPVKEAKRKRKKVKGSGMHFHNNTDSDADSDAGEGMSESDESALNMSEKMDESKFWSRVTGNLKGHEYILREAFRK